MCAPIQRSSICLIHYSSLPSLWAILLLLSMRQIYPLWPRAGSLITVIIFNKAYWLGNNLVLSCEPPVTREKAGLCRLAWDSISETVRGLRADHGPCSAVQNAICLQSGMTPVFIAWQRQSTSHSPWWLETVTDAGVAWARHNQQAGVKLSSDGKPVVFVARTGMAFQGGRRKLSQMDLSGMFTHCPN